jgi:hypothetical protein
MKHITRYEESSSITRQVIELLNAGNGDNTKKRNPMSEIINNSKNMFDNQDHFSMGTSSSESDSDLEEKDEEEYHDLVLDQYDV